MRILNWMVAGAVAAVLAGCGADEIASPGMGGNVTINDNRDFSTGGGNNGGGQQPPADLAQPAGACPTIANIENVGGQLTGGLSDRGTISGPTGEYRVCALPPVFTKNTHLARVPGVIYAIDGRVDVGHDLGPVDDGTMRPPHTPAGAAAAGVELGVDPGVIFMAYSGPSWVVVNRGNRINAVGSPERPIIFTSRDDVAGLANDASQGQWGGVVMLGRAPITDCANPGATPGTTACHRQTEGATDPAWFGGEKADDNSGRLQYVQIRYSGYVLSGNSELQSLTLGGVGSGTQISHIHSHNSSDDGFEVFGGTVKLRHFVITGADDDSIDVDTGYKGTIQHVIAVQKATSPADSVLELDSSGANDTTSERQAPRTHLKLANFTLVHRGTASGGNGAAVRLRGAADATLVNGVIVSSTWPALRVDNNSNATWGLDMLSPNAGFDKAGAPEMRSVVVQGANGVAFHGSSAAGFTPIFNTDGFFNNAAFTNSLANGFVNGSNEAGVTATDPTLFDPDFDLTNYIGAARPDDTWFQGWTCNSSYVGFGATSGSCTSLPSLEN